ncbi:hypothetical protein [Arvimicrobium flavum]|uniref:hypothetical protein n=1 Tax=Arvimicrobium flavum TaxID=3393320 RepID=UPI00237AB0D3|nr:hypothetical protein [Mesorhizobium shangrilense]
MSEIMNHTRVAAWHTGWLDDAALAAALQCEVDIVRALLGAPGFRDECGSGRDAGVRRLSPRLRVGLAVAHALHRQAGLTSEIAAEIVARSWRVCASVVATLDFVPPLDEASEIDLAAQPAGRTECDPLMLFAAHASEEIPIPAIDEYLDLIDGRRLIWRKPKHDAYRLACDLHRLSDPKGAAPTPNRQEEFLTLLSRMRERPGHVGEWIGIVDRRGFRPRPDRFADKTPFLRHGVDFSRDPHGLAEPYGSKVSVNISLAARSMKRRALGLEVVGVLDRPPRTAYPARRVTFDGSLIGSLPLGPAPARQSET